ncbi:adenylate kinase [candidate division KSB1 bacterium]
MNLIFLGAPGVGKGTQAKKIMEKYDIPQISTGDILRAALSEGTPLGLQAKSYMEKGELVPDDIIVGMIRERFKHKDTEHGFILDGFPRSLPQAEALDGLLEEMQRPLNAVIDIEVPEEDIVKRLANRRVCKKCGKVFNIITNPPSEHEQCEDGSECDIYQREDDREATIRNRLKVYHDQTAPLISFYEKKNLVKKVDGRESPVQVQESIVAIVEGLRG